MDWNITSAGELIFQKVIRHQKKPRLEARGKAKLAIRTSFQKGKRTGKQREKTVSWKNQSECSGSGKDVGTTWQDEPEHLAADSNETSRERNEEVVLCKFSVIYIWVILIAYLPSQGEKEDQIINLNVEVEALKTRCGVYEKKINDLESRCNTHENALEMLWQQVVCLQDGQGTLSTVYHEREYTLAP